LRSSIGGLRVRNPDALKIWIDERQAAGIIGFHTSLAGCGKTHDRWNGRAGNFDYQISILRMAGGRGMARQERLFLTRNALPLFDQLLDIMEAIPGELRSRIVTPFFYAGLARRYEDERPRLSCAIRSGTRTHPQPGATGAGIQARRAVGGGRCSERRRAHRAVEGGRSAGKVASSTASAPLSLRRRPVVKTPTRWQSHRVVASNQSGVHAARSS
jgi:hypothetical protein